jgi:gliding motility-associated-like protein
MAEFDTCYQTILFKSNKELWLKVITDGTVKFGNFEYPSKHNAIHYFKINENGQFVSHSMIPKYRGGIDEERYELMHAYPFIHDNHIYDINYFFNIFYDGVKPYATRGRGSFIHFPVLTKTTITELAISEPIATYSYDCSNIWLNLKYFDADHYTLLVSPDSVITPLKDVQGYNYALDYLLAPNYHGSKLMYQGNDTLVHLKNLISGNKYYFHIIPGKGQNENSTYNSNAALTLEINLPTSPLQNSLSINPKTDTASCQRDTIFANATSTYPIRWMDGKTENQRYVPETGKYYFTIKDSQDCVVSSDTIQIVKYPNEEIKQIVADTIPPFCIGDTVVFMPNSFTLNRFEYPKKYGALATSSGWQVVKIGTEFGCVTKDSIYVEFGQKPTFKFLQDSVLSHDRNIRLTYQTNVDSLLWFYGLDSSNSYTKYAVTDSQYLFVNAIDESGCNIWDSILTMYMEPISEAFPNAFTPNGDGVNDEWYFLHPDTAGTLIIYDRWGGIVHHGPNRWDGKKNGKTLPLGTYRYTFIYEENGD